MLFGISINVSVTYYTFEPYCFARTRPRYSSIPIITLIPIYPTREFSYATAQGTNSAAPIAWQRYQDLCQSTLVEEGRKGC